MALTNDSEYVHLMTELKDNSLLPIILEAAINGEINLSVTVKRTFPARRAPSRLSLFLTDHKNAEASFGEFMRPPHPLYQNTVERLLRSEIGTESSDKNYFLSAPKELLPDYYDIYEFGPSDYIYLNKDALITLNRKGVAYINSFICPPVSEQIIYDTQALYGTKLFDKNYNELPKKEELLELPHGVLDISHRINTSEVLNRLIKNDKEITTPRDSIAFYSNERAAFLIAREFKEIFPFTLQKILNFAGINPNNKSLRLKYDQTEYDFYSILKKCSTKLSKTLSADSMIQPSIVKLLSYVDKWAPLDIKDANIMVTRDDIFIAKSDLQDLKDLFNSAQNVKVDSSNSSRFDNINIKRIWLENIKFNNDVNKRKLWVLMYENMILSAFANQQIFENKEIPIKKSDIHKIIDSKIKNTVSILSTNLLFDSLRKKLGDKNKKLSEFQIADKIYQLATSPIDRHTKNLVPNIEQDLSNNTSFSEPSFQTTASSPDSDDHRKPYVEQKTKTLRKSNMKNKNDKALKDSKHETTKTEETNINKKDGSIENIIKSL